MRRLGLTLFTSIALLLASAQTASAALPHPEVDKANARMQPTVGVPPAVVSVKHCFGEDVGSRYTTYTMRWDDRETDVTPGSTDYDLTGNLTMSGRITINDGTKRGVLTGTATLISTPSGAPGTKQYSGPITMVVQEEPVPGGTGQTLWVARGLLNANAYVTPAGSTTPVLDGKLIANVEMQFTSGGVSPFDYVVARFGDSTAPLNANEPLADYASTFNQHVCGVAPSNPEVDIANASIDMPFTPSSSGFMTSDYCAGEDKPDIYTTYVMKWNAFEMESTPGSTDYDLTGDLTISAKITVNEATNRGIMIGTAKLVSTPSGGTGTKQYVGPITIVVQEVTTPQGSVWVGRGMINAPTYLTPAGGTPTVDGKLFANMEIVFGTGPDSAFDYIEARFGNGPALPFLAPVVPIADYSVAFNGKHCI